MNRKNGAIGALLDEYEKAIKELKLVIHNLSSDDLVRVMDNKTKDTNCRSIQTILTHVVESGYNYAVVIRKWLGEDVDYKLRESFNDIVDYNLALDNMFAYNEQLFHDYPDMQLEEYDPNKKVHVRWGQKYDVDQLIEHAIVHILRHRRQIERFKEKL